MKLTESKLRSIVRQELKRLYEATGEIKEAVDITNFEHHEIGIKDLAKRAVDMIIYKYAGKIYNTPSGEIESELISYLESVGLADTVLYATLEQAQEQLERIFKISF